MHTHRAHKHTPTIIHYTQTSQAINWFCIKLRRARWLFLFPQPWQCTALFPLPIFHSIAKEERHNDSAAWTSSESYRFLYRILFVTKCQHVFRCTVEIDLNIIYILPTTRNTNPFHIYINFCVFFVIRCSPFRNRIHNFELVSIVLDRKQ